MEGEAEQWAHPNLTTHRQPGIGKIEDPRAKLYAYVNMNRVKESMYLGWIVPLATAGRYNLENSAD